MLCRVPWVVGYETDMALEIWLLGKMTRGHLPRGITEPSDTGISWVSMGLYPIHSSYLPPFVALFVIPIRCTHTINSTKFWNANWWNVRTLWKLGNTCTRCTKPKCIQANNPNPLFYNTTKCILVAYWFRDTRKCRLGNSMTKIISTMAIRWKELIAPSCLSICENAITSRGR